MLALGAVVVAGSKKNTLRFRLACQLCKKSIGSDTMSVREDQILALHKLCADESAGERANWVPAHAREMGSGFRTMARDWPRLVRLRPSCTSWSRGMSRTRQGYVGCVFCSNRPWGRGANTLHTQRQD